MNDHDLAGLVHDQRRLLADQQRELDEVRAEVAALRRTLPSTGPLVAVAPTGAREHALSRRGLLRAAPAVLAGAAVATVARSTPAAAAVGGNFILGAENDGGATTTSLISQAAFALSVRGLEVTRNPNTEDAAPLLRAGGLTINDGEFNPGTTLVVSGGGYCCSSGAPPGTSTAIECSAVGMPALVAVGSDATSKFTGQPLPSVGVQAQGIGVSTGVVATSQAGRAVTASTSSATSNADAVVVSTAGLGRAIFATSSSTNNARGTVTGANAGTGAGLYATQSNATATGAAVVGVASSKGRGGSFKGGAAAVTLVPSTATTHPTSGNAGDLMVDSAKRLWFCSGGTLWKQLA